MSNEINGKKLLLGSALAGLMVAAPGLSVTTGKFFQTAKLTVGYGLAQAKEKKAGSESTSAATTPTTQGSPVDDTTMEGDPAMKGKKVVAEPAPAPESQPTPEKTEKKGDKMCGAGSCGSGK
jgi:Na+/H+-translocating membrane pyrophosphatase